MRGPRKRLQAGRVTREALCETFRNTGKLTHQTKCRSRRNLIILVVRVFSLLPRRLNNGGRQATSDQRKKRREFRFFQRTDGRVTLDKRANHVERLAPVHHEVRECDR